MTTTYYTPFYKKFDGKSTYFISDLHFQHKNLTAGVSSWANKTNCRQYDTVDEMNEAVIKSINDYLPPDAILFNGGDMLFGDKTKLAYWLSRIICKEHHYIYGNHCKWLRLSSDAQKLFTSCSDYLEIFCSRQDGSYKHVNLLHYPVKSWNERSHGSYMLTGHEHGNLPYLDDEAGLDVGWDVFHKPLSFHEIDAILSKRKDKGTGHHRKEFA